jgi:2-hydroxychromene-2-carboxylate isomerase
MTTIDYFFTPISPFVYLAGLRLEEIAARHGADISYRPVQLGRIFDVVGTKPLAERPEARKRYRLQELARISARTGLPINLRPAFWPVNPVPCSTAIIAAARAGGGDVGALAHGFARACWAGERNIAEDDVVAEVLAAHGFDPGLASRGMLSGVEVLERNTQEAIDRFVFGAPTYLVGEEMFWGQDRLADLDAHLGRA